MKDCSGQRKDVVVEALSAAHMELKNKSKPSLVNGSIFKLSALETCPHVIYSFPYEQRIFRLTSQLFLDPSFRWSTTRLYGACRSYLHLPYFRLLKSSCLPSPPNAAEDICCWKLTAVPERNVSTSDWAKIILREAAIGGLFHYHEVMCDANVLQEPMNPSWNLRGELDELPLPDIKFQSALRIFAAQRWETGTFP